MSHSPDPAHRAAEALRRAIDPGVDALEHLDFEQRAAYVDGTLDAADREFVAAHLEQCSACREDVRDLQEVAAQLPGTARPSTAVAPPRGRRDLRWMGVAAAVIVAVGAGVLWQAARVTAPAADGPAAPASPTQVSAIPQAPPAEDPFAPDEAAQIAEAMASRRIAVPARVRALGGTMGTLLGSSSAASFGVVAPVATAVSETRPEFSWRAHADAMSYSVEVYDTDFNEITRIDGLTTTTWVPRADLPRGRIYVWQVVAHTRTGTITSPAPPLPEARLLVLGPVDADAAAAARSRLADRPLELGVLLGRLGLIDDARRELTRARASADRSLVDALIASLTAQGRPTTTNPAQ